MSFTREELDEWKKKEAAAKKSSEHTITTSRKAAGSSAAAGISKVSSNTDTASSSSSKLPGRPSRPAPTSQSAVGSRPGTSKSSHIGATVGTPNSASLSVTAGRSSTASPGTKLTSPSKPVTNSKLVGNSVESAPTQTATFGAKYASLQQREEGVIWPSATADKIVKKWKDWSPSDKVSKLKTFPQESFAAHKGA